MNSAPLSESTPRIGNGIIFAMSLSAAITHFAPCCARCGSRSTRWRCRSPSVCRRPSYDVAAVVADQVDLHEPWLRIVPLCPGAHRDLTFEQRSRLGAATPLELMFPRSPARRLSMVAADIDTNSAAVSSSMSNSSNCRKPPPARSTSAPAAYRRASPVPPSTRSTPPRLSDRILVAADFRDHRSWAARRLEGLAGMVTMPTGRGAQLVENPALRRLSAPGSGSRSSWSQPCADQRQPHRPGLPRPSLIPPVDAPTRAF